MNEVILITGSSGFIGFHLAKKFLEEGYAVTGIDNHNDYYDVSLKEKRLSLLKDYPNFTFYKTDISEKESLFSIFRKSAPSYVFNMAAQAGVRYSFINPSAYVQSNINGFFNVLEACKEYKVKHLYFASSSSVYGNHNRVPYSEDADTDHPISFYAATKKSNEVMACSYSHLYSMNITGFRFFTVYGPYGRPDMAYYSFASAILKGEKIDVYNGGLLRRDFTYIDDIISGMFLLFTKDRSCNGKSFNIYNIGNNKPVVINEFINILEAYIGKKALIEYKPIQPGDVLETYADITKLTEATGFKPSTGIETGLRRFTDWFLRNCKNG